MFEASEALQKMEGMKKIKSTLFHQYSWNSEVETTWISLIGCHHKTSTLQCLCFRCWNSSKWECIAKHAKERALLMQLINQSCQIDLLLILWTSNVAGGAEGKKFPEDGDCGRFHLQYAPNYKPQFLYFQPIFVGQFNLFKGLIKFCPYVQLVFKSGLYWHRYGAFLSKFASKFFCK